jgi:CubicO group peptidase (beta-lactamase class C family)
VSALATARGALASAAPRWSRAAVADSLLDASAAAGFRGVVLVAHGDTILLRRAVGGRSGEVTPETAFWIGSLSKPFAAVATLQLVSAGRLALDDPITRFLPDVPAEKRGITIRQLLMHTSGLPTRYAADGVIDRTEAVRRILALPLVHAPGDTFAYSNDAYCLLAAILEVAAGKSYEEIVRGQILEPAGMVETGFWGEPVPAGVPALAPERRRAGARIRRRNYGYLGATGLRSTVDDLRRFDRALLDTTLLTTAMREQAFARQIRRGERLGYGYGWATLETPQGRAVLHSGGESDPDHYVHLRRYLDTGWTMILLSANREEALRDTMNGLTAVMFPGRQSVLR